MEELVRTAERILSGPFGPHAALRPERTLDGDKSTVLRCSLLDAAPPAPRHRQAVQTRRDPGGLGPVAWLEGFAAVAEKCGHATALGSSARAHAARLRGLWPPDVVDPPFFPAFRC